MKPVMVHTRIVSKYTPRAWTRPCLAGCDADEVAAALGTEPIPASLENRPRLMPWVMMTPIAAPDTDSMVNACWTMSASIGGTADRFVITTRMPRNRYRTAMTGTMNAVTLEIRCTPPRKTARPATPRTMPTIALKPKPGVSC